MLDLFISILGWIIVLMGLGMFYFILVKQDTYMFIKYIFLCLFLVFIYVVLSSQRLEKEVDRIYQTKQYQYGCGVFVNHLSNSGGRSGVSEKSWQVYQIQTPIVKQITGNCSFKKFQAFQVEKRLNKKDKVCIIYAKIKYKKEYHIYQIDLIEQYPSNSH